MLLIARETKEGKKTSALLSTTHLGNSQMASHMVANLILSKTIKNKHILVRDNMFFFSFDLNQSE